MNYLHTRNLVIMVEMVDKIERLLKNIPDKQLSMKEIADIINETWQDVDKCLINNRKKFNFDPFSGDKSGWSLQ